MNHCSETSRSQVEEFPASLHIGSVPTDVASRTSAMGERENEKERESERTIQIQDFDQSCSKGHARPVRFRLVSTQFSSKGCAGKAEAYLVRNDCFRFIWMSESVKGELSNL